MGSNPTLTASFYGVRAQAWNCFFVRFESLALEAFRAHALAVAQLRRLLGLPTRMLVEAFLKKHEVYDFTAADFEQNRATLQQLRMEEAQR